MLTIDEIEHFILQDSTDPIKQQAREGQRYYEADHDIKKYRLFYPDSDGHLVEDRTRSNIKISHPFFTELVDQAVQYMLSGKSRFAISDDKDIQSILDESLNHNPPFISELYDTLTGCLVKGSEYMYAYKDEDGRLSFQRADSLGVIEVRAKDTLDRSDYIIYHQIERLDKDRETIRKIQVWDRDKVWYYVKEGAKPIEKDPNVTTNPRPHIVYCDGKTDSLGFIPFFRLDLNRKRISSLKPIKPLIDDYDLMSCGLSNNLQDLTEGIFIVKNYMGDSIDDLIQTIKVKKAIGVDTEGDVDIKTIDIPYEARKVKLQLDEDNIYRFGMGLNSQKTGDGNITNVVIKSRYALLDLKCNKLEIQLKAFLSKLIKAILDDTKAKHTLRDVRISFERCTVTNALDNAQIALTEAETLQTRIETMLALKDTLGEDEVRKSIQNLLSPEAFHLIPDCIC